MLVLEHRSVSSSIRYHDRTKSRLMLPEKIMHFIIIVVPYCKFQVLASFEVMVYKDCFKEIGVVVVLDDLSSTDFSPLVCGFESLIHDYEWVALGKCVHSRKASAEKSE